MAGILKVDRVQSDSNLAFQVGASNVAYMNSTGLQMTGSQLSLGGTTIIPAVGQIAFPATQNPSSNANTLDDYEEGTFTPYFTGAVSNPTVTYSAQTGVYVKIGRQVTCWMRFYVTGSSGGSNALQISGLPFTSAYDVNLSWYGNASIGYFNGFSGTANYNDMKLLGPQSGTSYLRFHLFNSTGFAGVVDASTLANGLDIYVGCTYLTD